jgi:hypothetical protein
MMHMLMDVPWRARIQLTCERIINLLKLRLLSRFSILDDGQMRRENYVHDDAHRLFYSLIIGAIKAATATAA